MSLERAQHRGDVDNRTSIYYTDSWAWSTFANIERHEQYRQKNYHSNIQISNLNGSILSPAELMIDIVKRYL